MSRREDAGRIVEGYEGTSRMQPDERQACLDALPEHGLALEVGTWHGVTAAWLCSQRPHVTMLCLDNFAARCKHHTGDSELWLANRTPGMRLLVGATDDLGELAPGPYDWALIDAGHKYGECARDLENVAPQVTLYGLLLVHDYDSVPGVTRAVDRFLAAGGWKVRSATKRIIVMERAE